MNCCRGCTKQIPAGRVFCKRCLDMLSDDTRHRITFVDKSERAITLAVAELERNNGVPKSVATATEATNRFRAARQHAAAALRSLEAKSKEKP